MGAKSYFNVFLRNFLLVLCVPIITIFLLYFQAEKSVEKQIVSANNNTLYQFFRLIDEELDEMRNLVVTLGSDETCITYAQYALTSPDKTGYQGVLLHDTLSKYNNEKYEDIFIYFPYEDRVASGTHSILDKERYWETYYSGCDYADFVKELECQSFQPVLCSIDGEEQSYLCVAMRSRRGRDPLRDFVVVVVMRPSYLEKTMMMDERDANGELVIFDHQHNVLIGDVVSELDSLEIREEENASFVTSLNDGKYIIHMRLAKSIDGGYAFVMPYAYFWRELFSLRAISLIGAVLCIAVSVYIAYNRTRRIYRPLKNMVEQAELLSEDAYYDKKENNEFEFLENIVQETNKKISSLEQQRVEWEDIQKQYFARDLLEGNVADSNLEEEFRNKSMSLSVGAFCVAVMSVKKCMDIAADLQRHVLFDTIDGLYAMPTYVTPLTGERFAVIFCLEQEQKQESVVGTLEQTMRLLEKRSGILFSVGLGGVYNGVQGLRRSYKEAVAALKYKWLLGEGHIIEYGSISRRKMNYNSGSESKMFRMIMEFIKKDTDISAAELTTRIMELHDINSESAMDTVECFKYEIMSVIHNAVLHSGVTDDYSIQLRQLMEAPTISQYREQLSALFDELRIWYRENTNNAGICDRAVAYVEKNYSDPNLSVAEISREVNLTSSYLTKQFRTKYNISVLDYIAQVRITNAKALLKDNALTIKQISGMVGFMSDNVFIKTFKKWEGITPGQYRDSRLEP